MAIKLLTAAFASFLIVSYAHAQEPAKPEPASRATIVVYRTPGFIGVLVTHVPRVNGIKAARLKTKTYTTLSVSPGEVTVCIFGDVLCLQPFQVVAGTTYYIRDTADSKYAGSGVTANEIYLQRVDESTGAQQLAGLKQVQPEAAFQ